MIDGLRTAAKKMGLGPLLLRAYHRPVGLMRLSIEEGGPFQQRRTTRGRLAMIEAAAELPTLSEPVNRLPVPVTFLSGEKYWYQTLFCIVSLQQQVGRRVDAVIFDDGSFTEATREKVRRVVPWVHFVDPDEAAEALDSRLPESRYPSLRKRRIEYPHLRKLTDLHCQAPGWTLVLDSDMLFFRRPEALIEWIDAPDDCIYMQDVATAYGYSADLLTELVGHPVPEKVNVGLYSLYGPSIDWDRLEYWCAQQLEREGPNYLQEQALVAMLIAMQKNRPLPAADYVVMPDLSEGREPQAVLHHYVAHSKRSYFQHCWPRIARTAGLPERASPRA